MRSKLLTATSLATTLLFLVPGAALAQAVHNWSGGYLGLGAGVVSSQTNIDLTYNGVHGTSPDSINIPMLGKSGTIVGGYNWQSGNFVYGIEADGSLLTVSGSSTGSSYDASAALDRLLSLRGRIGVATGQVLLFATAGLAAGHVSFNTLISEPAGGPSTAANASGVVFGQTGGVGVEYAVNDNVSLSLEGLVTHLGGVSATGDNGKGTYTATSRPSTSFGVRGGINFHFN